MATNPHVTDIWHFHPWGDIGWTVLSRVEFCSSCCAREACPQVPCLSQPLTQRPHFSLHVPGWPFIPQPALKLTYFPNVTREGVVPNHSVGLLLPLPFLLAAWPALASLHLSTLSPSPAIDARISSHIALSSFPEGPRSASHSILFCYSSVRRHGSFFRASPLHCCVFLFLSLHFPSLSPLFLLCLFTLLCPHPPSLRSTLPTIISG